MSDAGETSDPQLHRDRGRAVSFGTVAEIYDRARPTYPDALVRDLLAERPLTVLDVGCGTGRVAVLFAAQGCDVLGVEPDEGMAAVARGHGVEVETASFEDWAAAGRRFDLLVSGQAWHWVDPQAGAQKAATVLRSGGRIGLFWNMDTMANADRSALDAAYEQVAPELMHRNRTYGGRRAPRGPVVAGLSDAGFTAVEEREYSWQRRYTTDEYVELIQTFSDHNLLPADQRGRLLAVIHDALEPLGGLDVTYDCHLVTAVAP